MVTRHCEWCGKEYICTGSKKYCSDDCKVSALKYKNELAQKSIYLDIEQACSHHRRNVKAEMLTAKNKVLTAVHYSSSAVRFEWIVR